jgi:hypothetical protein
MTVGEVYEESVRQNFKSLVWLIEYLCFEKKVLELDRDARNIDYILENYDVDTIIKNYKESIT